MKSLSTRFCLLPTLLSLLYIAPPAASLAQWTSAHPSINLAGDFNGWDTLSSNMVLIANGTWQRFETLGDPASIQFKFAAPNFPDSATWGELNQSNFEVPIVGRGEKPGGNIVAHGTRGRTLRFVLNEANGIYRVTDASPVFSPWINEVDYDNVGIDSNEWVELAGAAGQSLDDYELRFINQAGTVYRTIDLADAGFTFLDEDGGVGTFVLGATRPGEPVADFTPDGWDTNMIQNGPADSIQLRLKSAGTSIHVIDQEAINPHTQEDQVTPKDDVTNGHASVSLSGGPGLGFGDFAWIQTVLRESPGDKNYQQTFSDPSSDVILSGITTDPAIAEAGVPMHVEAELTPVNGASDFVATVFYRAGSSGSFVPRAMALDSGNTWRTVTPIPGQPTGTQVDYYLFVNFNGVGRLSPVLEPANAPTSVYSYAVPRLATGSVWLNEMNYRLDFFSFSPTNEYLEVAGPAGSDISDWQIQLFDASVRYATYTLPPATLLPNDEDGYGFLVLGDSGTPNVDIVFTNVVSGERNVNETGAVRLVNETGAVEYEFTYTSPQTNQYPGAHYIGNDDSATFVDRSLGLIGSGEGYADLAWATNDLLTPGAMNDGQALTGGSTSNLPPVIICPGDLVLQSVAEVPEADISEVFASAVCGDGSVTVTWVGDVTNGGSGCLGDPRIITRTYRAVSDCATTAECSQVITVEDTVAPIILCEPTQLVNPGFETGDFTGWTSRESAAVLDEQPASGFFHAALSADSLEHSLVLWLDANDPDTVHTRNDEIGAWEDKSGKQHTLRPDSGHAPILVSDVVNGQSAVRFTPTDYLTRGDGLGFSGNPALTVFTVARADDSATRSILCLGAASSTAGKIVYFCSDVSVQHNDGSRRFQDDALTNEFHRAAWSRPAGGTYASSQFWKNGIEATATGTTNPDQLLNLADEKTYLGASLNAAGGVPGVTAFDGDIAEILVFNRELTDAEHDRILAYLDDKYFDGTTEYTPLEDGFAPTELYQDLPAAPGQAWDAAIEIRMPSSDPLQPGDSAYAELQFLDAQGEVLDASSTPLVTSTNPVDTYVRYGLDGVAPAGTSIARLRATITAGTLAGGSVYLDDALLSQYHFETGDFAGCEVPAPDLTGLAAVIDDDPNVVVLQTPDVGSPLSIDDPSILLIATDCGGLSATCSVQVAISDTCNTNGVPEVVILDVSLTSTNLAILSTGTNTWSIDVDYSTNLTDGELGWVPVDSLENTYNNGTNLTVFGLPVTPAPATSYRVRQTAP